VAPAVAEEEEEDLEVDVAVEEVIMRLEVEGMEEEEVMVEAEADTIKVVDKVDTVEDNTTPVVGNPMAAAEEVTKTRIKAAEAEAAGKARLNSTTA